MSLAGTNEVQAHQRGAVTFPNSPTTAQDSRWRPHWINSRSQDCARLLEWSPQHSYSRWAPGQTARRAGSLTTPNQDALLGCLSRRVDREKTRLEGTVFLFCWELLVLPSEPLPAGSTTWPRKGLCFIQ